MVTPQNSPIPKSPGPNHHDRRAGPPEGQRLRRIRRRGRRLRRRIAPISVAPSLVTLGNLVAGFAAIHYATKPIDASGPWGWSTLTVAGALVFIGMFLDSIDGSIARLTDSASSLGAQLDSLADLVTFGVAPAFMMLRLASHYVGPEGAATILGPEADTSFAKILWGVAAVYVCCTALRLARFNVETPSAAVDDHLVFRGLPSPAAAGAVASLIVLHQHWLFVLNAPPDDVSVVLARWSAFGIPLLTILCAVAMVSSIPYVHFMNRYVRGRRSFAYLARLVIPIFLAIWWFQETIAFAFTAYAVYSPARMMVTRLRRRTRASSAETRVNASPSAAGHASPDAPPEARTSVRTPGAPESK